MSRRRNVIVEGVAPEDRVRPVLVMAPFTTHDGHYARTGDTLVMTPDEIAVRAEAHQVRPLVGNATTRVRRFIRGTAHRRSLRRPTP
jgi:hypothetical protein